MKKLIITLSFVCCAVCMYAQDLISLNDGTTIKAKVTEVSDNEIVYKKFSNLEGPSYRAKKNLVSKITYANGSTEIYSQHTAKPVVKNELKKTIFQVDPLGIVQFGPVMGVEFLAGQNSYIDVHYRWVYGGLLYHMLASDFFNRDYQASITNSGIGIGYKYMLPSRSSHRMYIGGFLEHLKMSETYNPGEWNEEESKTKGIVYCADWGYRWHFSKMSLSVGANIGFQNSYYSKYSDEDFSERGLKTSKEEGTMRPLLLAKVTLGF